MLDDVFIQLCVILKKQFHCHNKSLRKKNVDSYSNFAQPEVL